MCGARRAARHGVVSASLVARIGMETEFSLSQAVASGDAFEHRASERGHCVEDFSAELNLRDLPGEAAGFEFGADDALPTAHLRFYSAALVVPCCRLPSHAPVAADLAKMAIPNGRITRRLRADHCVLWRDGSSTRNLLRQRYGETLDVVIPPGNSASLTPEGEAASLCPLP